MSEAGNSIQNRLKMFEHNKIIMGKAGTNDTDSSCSNIGVKLVVTPKKTYDAPHVNTAKKTIVATQIQGTTQSKEPTSAKAPPVRRPPPNLTAHIKVSPINQKPAVGAPPPLNLVAHIPKPQNDEVTSNNQSSTVSPPVGISSRPSTNLSQKVNVASSEESHSSKFQTKVTKETSTVIPKAPIPPSTIISQSKVLPGTQGPPVKRSLLNKLSEIDSATSVAKMEDSPSPISTINIPTQTSRVSSATAHPPPPLPPPPKSNSTSKVGNVLINPECPPPVPPPPPNIIKSNVNSVVGWATATNQKELENDVQILDKGTKINEINKPPPILVAPPSLESFEKVVKLTNRKAPISPENEIADYDEDDDYVNSPWYFDVTKGQATNLMRNHDNIGTFMVRPSDPNVFVLMVRANSELVKKFKIQQHNNGWVLGDPTKCKRIHPSISSLMDFYCENGVKIGNSTLKLKDPVPKE